MQKIWGGSAKKLQGTCVMVMVFVSDNQTWKDSEKQDVLEQAQAAAEWIQAQASEYEINVEFVPVTLNVDEDVTGGFPDLNADNEDRIQAGENIIEQLGFGSISEFDDYIHENYGDTNFHTLFFINRTDRSYMTSFPITGKDQDFEVNIVFKDEGINRINSMVIAHETLHAYSAFDLYNVDETSEGEAAMKYAEENFPEEIMLSSVADVNECTLSEFTAFLVGWHSEPEDWYENMVQPRSKEDFENIMLTYENYDEEGNLIIESEEILAQYTNEERELCRLQINENENLIIWRETISDEEEEILYDETSYIDGFYHLISQNDGTKICIHEESGKVYLFNIENNEYEDYYETELA